MVEFLVVLLALIYLRAVLGVLVEIVALMRRLR